MLEKGKQCGHSLHRNREIRTNPVFRILPGTEEPTKVYTKLRLTENMHQESLFKSSLLGCWTKRRKHLIKGAQGTLTMCSYWRFGRILLEIAPVSVTEMFSIRMLRERNCRARLSVGTVWGERGCPSLIAVARHQLASSIVFFSLSAGSAFFPAELCSRDNKPIRGRWKLLLLFPRTSRWPVRRVRCLPAGALGANHPSLLLIYFLQGSGL